MSEAKKVLDLIEPAIDDIFLHIEITVGAGIVPYDSQDWTLSQREDLKRKVSKILSDYYQEKTNKPNKKLIYPSEQISELTQRISAIETGEGLRRMAKAAAESGISLQEYEQASCEHIYGFDEGCGFVFDPSINLDVSFDYCPKCAKKLK